MEAFVVILAVLIFSIFDAAVRKQRRTGGGAPAGGRDRSGTPPSGSTPGSGWGALRDSLLDAAQRAAEARRESVGRTSPSAGALAPELWDEIRKLARARGAEVPGVEPARRPGAPALPAPAPRAFTPVATAARPAPAAPVHPVHRTHPKMGRPLAERLSPLDNPEDEAVRDRPAPEVTDVRRMLGGGAKALRRAVILEEVLGPPAALRGDPYEPAR